ncbi:hypothetical protein E2C01_094553 [Portunus trituberculatus]|uniref:Uncharacterized protein n=1 Tax=Portunus trituberculatus TaxID=210409 RepID=A0A5B7K104_PORTR|nr:hypothetical protein [Portunus trituberculatus]
MSVSRSTVRQGQLRCVYRPLWRSHGAGKRGRVSDAVFTRAWH